MQINEGGNVFKDAQGQPLTQRINKADVPATIKWIEQGYRPSHKDSHQVVG